MHDVDRVSPHNARFLRTIPAAKNLISTQAPTGKTGRSRPQHELSAQRRHRTFAVGTPESQLDIWRPFS